MLIKWPSISWNSETCRHLYFLVWIVMCGDWKWWWWAHMFSIHCWRGHYAGQTEAATFYNYLFRLCIMVYRMDNSCRLKISSMNKWIWARFFRMSDTLVVDAFLISDLIGLGPDLIWSQIRFWGPVGGVVLESLSLGWDVQFDSLIEILLEAHERSWKLMDPHGIL